MTVKEKEREKRTLEVLEHLTPLNHFYILSEKNKRKYTIMVIRYCMRCDGSIYVLRHHKFMANIA